MKHLLAIYLLLLSSAFAWDPPVSQEQTMEHAVWVGRGVITSRVFVGDIADAFIWKATLTVHKTLKGKPRKQVEFYFEQSQAPRKHDLRSSISRFRCPPYPVVEKGEPVTIYLRDVPSGALRGFHLNSLERQACNGAPK